MRLRATVTIEYNAYHGDYQTYKPEEAAEIDQANWRNDPAMFFASFGPADLNVHVEVVPATVT